MLVTGSEGSYDYSDADASETGEAPPGQPWYRRPIFSLTIGLFIAFLLGLALFLMADNNSEYGGTTQTPTSPTTSVNAPAR